jgi:hypothetical protein
MELLGMRVGVVAPNNEHFRSLDIYARQIPTGARQQYQKERD